MALQARAMLSAMHTPGSWHDVCPCSWHTASISSTAHSLRMYVGAEALPSSSGSKQTKAAPAARPQSKHRALAQDPLDKSKGWAW